MGTYINSGNILVRKHIFTTSLILRIKGEDRAAWQSFVGTLPTAYSMREIRRIGDLIEVMFEYTARGANTHDLTRRLNTSGLRFLDYGSGGRVRECTCPTADVTNSMNCEDNSE